MQCEIRSAVSFVTIHSHLVQANVKVDEVCRAQIADLDKYIYRTPLNHIFPLIKFYSLFLLSRHDQAKIRINSRPNYLRLDVFKYTYIYVLSSCHRENLWTKRRSPLLSRRRKVHTAVYFGSNRCLIPLSKRIFSSPR